MRTSHRLRRGKPKQFLLQENQRFPNSELPVLYYPRAVAGDELERNLYITFQQNDWGGCWTDGIFGYHHFHSNAHEALGVAEGWATLVLGGEGGLELDVKAGDVLVLPAGTAHRRIKDSPGFAVVGAYPPGQEKFDEYLSKENCANCRNRLRIVPRPATDPLFGEDGPLPRVWNMISVTA